jgi:AraC-like DNA-binding protein
MKMILLALTCERVMPIDAHLVQMIMAGDLNGVMRIGQEKLERTTGMRDAERHAAIGQIVGRALLAADRPEDAEELFQHMLKTYEAISRSSVRWMSSLDQAAVSLHLGRWGRAAEVWNLVADDETAPVQLRVEAMAGMAYALFRLGEQRRALNTLREAKRLAGEAGLPQLRDIVNVLEIEQAARARLYGSEGLSDFALNMTEVRAELPSSESLCVELRQQAALMANRTMVVRCMEVMRMLLSGDVASSSGRSHLRSELKWLNEHGFTELESALRIDAALATLSRDDATGTTEILGSLAHDHHAYRRYHSLELMYCSSRLHAIQGRHGDALRLYKDYARESLYRVTRERVHVPRSRFLERQLMVDEGDSAMFRLPLRYRRAYRFIVEHLGDSQLSIKHVAAHIDVTERALQMAFRKHLGMTPAELIRHHRMQGIRKDLTDGTGSDGVLKTAARWGMANRSTLAHGYRQLFSETPTATLRGGN